MVPRGRELLLPEVEWLWYYACVQVTWPERILDSRHVKPSSELYEGLTSPAEHRP